MLYGRSWMRVENRMVKGIFFALLKKHYKIIFASRATLYTVIFGPLLFILLIGLAFNTVSTQPLSIGYYYPVSSELGNEVLDALRDNFTLEEIHDVQLCEDLIAKDYFHVCLVFPEVLDPTSLQHNGIIDVYVDSSELSLAYLIMDQFGSEVLEQSEEVSQRYVSEILDALDGVSLHTQSSISWLNAARGSSSTVLSDLSSAENDIESMNFTFDTPHISLSSSLSSLASDASSLNSAATQIDSLESSLSSAIKDIDDELALYEEECVVNVTASDCVDRALQIIVLEDHRDDLVSYQSTLSVYDFSGVSSTLYVELSDLSFESEHIDEKLNDAHAKFLELEEKTNDVKGRLSNSFSQTNTILSRVNEVSASQSSSLSLIEGIPVRKASSISSPIQAKYSLLNSESTFIHKLFPALLALFVMLVSIVLASTFVLLEKKSSAFIRNHIAPVQRILFPLSTVFVLLTIILVESFILVGIGFFFFGIDGLLFSHLLLGLLVCALVFCLIGLCIGFFFESQEGASLTSLFLSIALLLFSPLIFPLESMSLALANAARISPFVLSSEMFKKIILFTGGFDLYLVDLGFLLVYVLLLFGVFVIAYRRAVRRY